jgi:nitrogen fixation protein
MNNISNRETGTNRMTAIATYTDTDYAFAEESQKNRDIHEVVVVHHLVTGAIVELENGLQGFLFGFPHCHPVGTTVRAQISHIEKRSNLIRLISIK